MILQVPPQSTTELILHVMGPNILLPPNLTPYQISKTSPYLFAEFFPKTCVLVFVWKRTRNKSLYILIIIMATLWCHSTAKWISLQHATKAMCKNIWSHSWDPWRSHCDFSEQTKLKHWGKGQKHAATLEFCCVVVLNFNAFLVPCIAKFNSLLAESGCHCLLLRPSVHKSLSKTNLRNIVQHINNMKCKLQAFCNM